jgi:hypothetical protein
MLKFSSIIKKSILFFCGALFLSPAKGQKNPFDLHFYGFIRGDLYYNSRSNVEAVDGLFYLYPKQVAYDADGKDLNASSNSGFYTFTTRLGLNIAGPAIGSAETSAKIETDFGGTNDIHFMLRLRQAYLKLEWKKGSSLLLGQTWHPLFGEVAPTLLNLSTGAPFQPFNRSPQLHFQHKSGGLALIGAAIYQSMYTSMGPDGKSQKYLKNGVLPELYVGADYRVGKVLIGAGVDLISIKPREQSVVNGDVYRVDERVTALSYELHVDYTDRKLKLAGKTLLASNQVHNVMLGGYGVKEINERTGEQTYTPFRHSTSWINCTYGQKHQVLLFAGYTKNLGTPDALLNADQLYGTGLDIDRFFNLSLAWRYAIPHWQIGLECTRSTAWYGEINLKNGKVGNACDATNHRIESVFIYTF